MLYSNFSYTLYGMAVGGKKWTQILVDHPEILSIPYGVGRRQEVYRLAIEAMQENIMLFGSFYFQQLGHFLFSFIKYDLIKMPYYFLFDAYQIVTVMAGVWILSRWREPLAQLGLFMFMGVLFSAPFLMQDAGVRPFASVYPMFAVIPAIAIGFTVRLVDLLQSANQVVQKSARQKRWPIIVLGISPFLLIVVGPILAVMAHQQPVWQGKRCPKNEAEIIIRGDNSVIVNIFDDKSLQKTQVPNSRRSDFFNTFPGSLRAYRERLEKQSLPFAIVLTRNLTMLVVDSPLYSKRGHQTLICVRDEHQDGYARGYVSGESSF